MESGIFKALGYSLLQVVVAATWVLRYGAARKDRKYAAGRQAITSDARFGTFGKVIFIVSNTVTLFSFWTNTKALLLFAHGDAWRIAGLFVLLAATLLHVKALRHLGDNYSPCFDAHRPFRIVRQGPYQYIRHPIYLANILLCVGYSLASRSVWVLALSAYGAYKIISALLKEESYLAQAFPDYKDYQAQTARLLPFIY